MFIVFFLGVWRKNLVIFGRNVGEVETKEMNAQVYPWAVHLIKMSQRRKPFRPVAIIIYTIQVWNHHKRFCTVWTLATIVSSLKWCHGPIIHNFNYNSALLHKSGCVSHISRRQMPSQYLATLHIWYDNMTISRPTKKAQGECENELQNFSPHYELVNTSALPWTFLQNENMSLANASHHLPSRRSPWCRLLATKTSIPSGPSRSWKRISSEFWQRLWRRTVTTQRFHMTFGISLSKPKVNMNNDHSKIPNIWSRPVWEDSTRFPEAQQISYAEILLMVQNAVH